MQNALTVLTTVCKTVGVPVQLSWILLLLLVYVMYWIFAKLTKRQVITLEQFRTKIWEVIDVLLGKNPEARNINREAELEEALARREEAKLRRKKAEAEMKQLDRDNEFNEKQHQARMTKQESPDDSK